MAAATSAAEAATDLRQRIARARTAAERLRELDDGELFARIDRIVRHWLDPTSAHRQRAQRLLLEGGFSAAMIAHGLPLHFEPLRAPAIERLVSEELGRYRPGGAPRLITHILPGNLPGTSAAPVLLSLALRFAVLTKSAAGERVFPALLADSIVALEPLLGECVIATTWRGGDDAVERTVFELSDVLVASGSDETIAAIAPRVRGQFIGHGHKISFAAIARDVLRAPAESMLVAERLAYDVSLWDQQGCLSPQVCFVERGGAVTIDQLAELLAEGLQRWAATLPPRRLSFEERAAIARFRQAAEWTAGSRIIASEDTTDWTIAIDSVAALTPTCLNRCIRLQPIDDLARLAELLAPQRDHLECCGLAAIDRKAELARMLNSSGVHRVCAIGEMQRPTLAWRQGGRPRVREWVQSC